MSAQLNLSPIEDGEVSSLQAQPLAQAITPLVQRDGDDLPQVPNYQLNPPSLLAPVDPANRYRLGGDRRLQLDPQLQAAALRYAQQQLSPINLRPNLAQLQLSSTPLIPLIPSPAAAPAPLVPAGEGPETTREGNSDDLLRAALAVPIIDTTLTQLRTRAEEHILHNWHRLQLGEQVGAVSALAVIGAGAIAGMLSNAESRQWALNQLNGQVLPVPGVDYLRVEINTSNDALMVGFHLDVGALLPGFLGFGPGSATAIGGPPQPEEFIPGLQRSPDTAQPTAPQPNLETRLNASRSGGSPLPKTVRQFMEPRFGFDFSQVKVHNDADAVQMNRELGAQAFAHGNHIYYGAGKPPANDHLTGHELTHVVQQTGRLDGARTVQRLCDPAVATCPPPVTSGLPLTAAQSLTEASATLRRIPALAAAQRDMLSRSLPGAVIVSFIQDRDRKREELQQRTQELTRIRPEHGTPEPGSALDQRITVLSQDIDRLNQDIDRLNQMVQAGLQPLNLEREEQLLTLINERFPQMFVERGKQIAIAELNQNQQIVEEEVERYGLNACVDPAARQGLRQAAQDLVTRNREIEQRQAIVQAASQLARSDLDLPSAGVPDPATMGSSYYDLQHAQARMEEINQLVRDRDQRRQAYALQYPILLQNNLDITVIATGSDQQLNELLGSRIQTILTNIEQTKTNIENGRLKIWNLRNIVQRTEQDLGIGSTPILQAAIQSHVQQEQTDAATLSIALAALAITAGIVATAATGGVALVAGGAGLAIGGYSLSESVQNYLAETAAQDVALDPQIADLSANEPELHWVILDLVGLGFDVAGVIQAFNGLRTAARAIRTIEEVEVFAQTARRVVGTHPGAVEQLVATATRQSEVSASIARTVQQVGTAFRRADLTLVLLELRQVAEHGMSRVVQRLIEQGRIHPLTEDAMEAVLGSNRAHELITDGYLRHLGFYDPQTRNIFLRNGSMEGMTSTLVHETTHYLQDIYGTGCTGFRAEFQALAMEREYILRLEREFGRSAIASLPEDLRWLASATDERLAYEVTELWGYTNPTSIDLVSAVEEVLQTVTRF